ncbi:hypothetical protein C818_03773 [Lachnospiraceae bacterium MD308]|jgi:AraC-type DNA-binding domain-containing proteins|nr:hypothetical protein C818_03773 [Lachnospiraceae bacterium MD308]MCI8503475.1 helix-turn-helix transcriptional regulator [Dorea sp.]
MQGKRNYLKNITELNFSGYKFILYYGEELNEGIAEFPHYHYPFQIYYVIEGNLHINIAGIKETVSTNGVLFLAHNIQHHVTYTPDESKRYFTIIFDVVSNKKELYKGPDGPLEYQDLINAIQSATKKGYCISENFHADSLLKALYEELDTRQIGWNTALVNCCYQFFLKVLRHISNTTAKDSELSGTENLAMAASMYIHAHYAEEISIEKVAKQLNVSPRHINRSYTNMFGTTFIKNTNLLRIAYAKNYLCETDDSLEMIAEKVGFSSVRSFYKLFQKYEGISPGEYRVLHQKK